MAGMINQPDFGAEKDAHIVKGGTSGSSDDGINVADGVVTRGHEYGFWTRNGCTLESLKRRTIVDEENQLNQTMKTRHLHMIAIGGSIGAGLFVGSGSALRTGGPAALIIDFGIIGIMIFNVVHALGELAVMYPVSGGFYTFSTRFVDPSWGFAMGWNYVMQWAIVLPLELVVAGFTVQYWNTSVNVAVWITLFLVAIVVFAVFGVLGYAEEEFWAALLKLSAVIIFMIVSLVLVCGGGPAGGQYSEYWGARLWYNPGAFANGFKGVCSVFVTAAFAFSGTELVGLAAAEAENPAKSLPGAIKQVFWRITLFYILALMFVGFLVPYTEPQLLGERAYGNTAASPFVIAARNAGLDGLDHFLNFVIIVSVMSIGISGVYGGSRTLTALAEQGYAPKIFTYIDRAGRPLYSTIAIIAFGPLAYSQLAADGPTVFSWLLAISGLAALFTWGSICLAHIRFRQAWKHHGHTVDEIPFQAVFGVTGSWIGFILVILVFIAQFYTAAFPIGEGEMTSMERAEAFFNSYLAFFVVIVFWVGGFLWKRGPVLTLDKIDVDSGRRPVDWDVIHAQRAKEASWPVWRRALNKII